MKELAERLVAWGMAFGADEIEVSVVEGREFSVDVRRARIENLVEAGSRVLGLRVIKDKRTAVALFDLGPATLRRSSGTPSGGDSPPDPFAGLARTPSTLDAASLRLHDPEVPALAPQTMIGLALETERIALADKRITNSYGASFSSDDARIFLANSNGFSGGYSGTYCGLGVGLQAGSTNERVEDSWYSSKRFFRELASPEAVARKAVERTVRQLRPRKVRTKNVPVVFEPTMTSWVLGFLFSCIADVGVPKASSLPKAGARIGSLRRRRR
jgi:PmbA protein